MVKKILAFGFITVLALSLLLITAGAASGIENITLTHYSASVLPNGNTVVNYTLTKINGTYSFGTDLYIVGNKQLISNGITVLLTDKSGNPPIVGTMYVFSSTTTPIANYTIVLAGNSSGVTVNAAKLKFDVVSKVTASTTLKSTSTSSTSIVSTTTTVPSNANATTTATGTLSTAATTSIAASKTASGGSSTLLYVAIVVIIILIIGAVLYVMRDKLFVKRPRKPFPGFPQAKSQSPPMQPAQPSKPAQQPPPPPEPAPQRPQPPPPPAPTPTPQPPMPPVPPPQPAPQPPPAPTPPTPPPDIFH